MKTALVLSALILTSSFAHAQNWCSDLAHQALETQARADFKDPSITGDAVEVLDSEAGQYLIKFADVRKAGVVIANYRIDIGETCQIMGVNRVK